MDGRGQDRSPGSRRRGPLGCGAMLLLTVAAILVVYVGLTPWALHIGGRSTPLEQWDGYGEVRASNGGKYLLFTHLAGRNPRRPRAQELRRHRRLRHPPRHRPALHRVRRDPHLQADRQRQGVAAHRRRAHADRSDPAGRRPGCSPGGWSRSAGSGTGRRWSWRGARQLIHRGLHPARRESAASPRRSTPARRTCVEVRHRGRVRRRLPRPLAALARLPLSRFVTSSAAPTSAQSRSSRPRATAPKPSASRRRRPHLRRIKSRERRVRGIIRRSGRPASHHATRHGPRPTTGHARNQDGTTASAQLAPRSTTHLGWRSQGRRAETARPSLDAPRHAAEGRSAIPGADHHSRDAGAAVAPLAPAVRSAPARHRAGVGRQVPGDSLLDPAGPRPLHRRGGRGPARPRRVCTAWRSAWRWRSTALSGAKDRSSAIATTCGR